MMEKRNVDVVVAALCIVQMIVKTSLRLTAFVGVIQYVYVSTSTCIRVQLMKQYQSKAVMKMTAAKRVVEVVFVFGI